METTLKPCSFCGSEDVSTEWMNDYCYVACDRCMTTGPAAKVDGMKDAAAIDGTRRLAETAWNWRPQKA